MRIYIYAVYLLYTEYCTLQVYLAETNVSSNIFLALFFQPEHYIDMVADEKEASDDDDVDAAALEEETRASTNPNICNDGQNTEDDEMDELEASPVASIQAIPVVPVQATTSRLLITNAAKRTRTADPPKKKRKAKRHQK